MLLQFWIVDGDYTVTPTGAVRFVTAVKTVHVPITPFGQRDTQAVGARDFKHRGVLGERIPDYVVVVTVCNGIRI